MCKEKHYGIRFETGWMQDGDGKIFVTTCTGVAKAYQELNGGEIKEFCNPELKEKTKQYIASTDMGSRGQYGMGDL
jgi:hypothetical protein